MPIRFSLVLFLALLGACKQTTDMPSDKPPTPPRPAYAIAIHGGARALRKADMTPEKDRAYRAALDSALTIGETILQNGGSALDAVEQTVRWLEDCPLFNAGRGAVFTYEGQNELDAGIMDGATQRAGAVGSVTTVRNPITLARAVMEKSPHVLLTGDGAEQFAREHGIDTVPPSWFFTQERWDALQNFLAREKAKGKSGALSPSNSKPKLPDSDADPSTDYKFGTVGCVALDAQGHLAAATSTGGMTGKRWNRFGDAPIIGAGTYADDAACAVSCTGHGEFFIRYAVAHDVWALMVYKNMSLEEATDLVINKKLVEKGGEGGLISVDKNGNIALPFNSEGMYRGYARPGERNVMIYRENEERR